MQESRMKYLIQALLAVVAFTFAMSVHAQTALTLRGTITDSSGGAVANAHVAIEDQASGFHASHPTDADGNYEFAQILPGRYKITVTSSGFATQSKEAQLLVSQPL
jgi:Carboxypeptidase regulatory-like domain